MTITDYVPIKISNSQPYATPYYYQVDINATSSTYFSDENALLQNVEFFTDPTPLTTSGTLLASWLESGNSNTATNSVYWVRLPASLAPTTGSTTIYMGLASISTNLFCQDNFYTPPGTTDNCSGSVNGMNGLVGEAPTLSPSYGLYDNGANVFNLYDDFAGKTLSSAWATSSQIGTDYTAQAAIGKLTTNTCSANTPNLIGSTGVSEPGGVAYDSFGDLWVADSCDNRVLMYPAASLSSNDPTPTVVIGQTTFADRPSQRGIGLGQRRRALRPHRDSLRQLGQPLGLGQRQQSGARVPRRSGRPFHPGAGWGGRCYSRRSGWIQRRRRRDP